MKKMRLKELMCEYDELKKKLEAKGYSEIVRYEQVILPNRIACRLLQLAMAAFFVTLLAEQGDALGVLIIWALMHGAVSWFFRIVSGRSSLVKCLSVSGYFAKRKMRAEIEKLSVEVSQLDVKERKLEPILEKFGKISAVIEDQLGGETKLVKKVGENPRLKVLIARDEVLAKIIQPRECVLEENPCDKSDFERFNERYVWLLYDVTREGAYEELSYNVSILLEWKKTKAAEKEIAARAAKGSK